ncbi:hypothetical protein PAL_GLEAN10003389 [Pteropus alecto]|uniref:Uncharacterized protein n=1 Tax=Pteropus alecto TaxID=9402 RepID=L5KEU8_PTEAL|nr:hypothetical protein PAL_GLEAN10003389 [Pteropus alecto]
MTVPIEEATCVLNRGNLSLLPCLTKAGPQMGEIEPIGIGHHVVILAAGDVKGKKGPGGPTGAEAATHATP